MTMEEVIGKWRLISVYLATPKSLITLIILVNHNKIFFFVIDNL